MDLEQKILQIVEDSFEEQILFLQDMVRTPSINPPGDCEKISEVVAGKFREIGLKTEIIKAPISSDSKSNDIPIRNNALGWWHGKDNGPILALVPHIDTVPVVGEWQFDPYEATICNGKLYGRGAIDSKGRLAAYLFALSALLKAEADIKGTVVIMACADEETGGEWGARFLLDSGHVKPDMAIVEGSAYTVWQSMNGVLHMKIEVRGKSSHAAAPQRGVDAVRKMNKVLNALYEYGDTIAKRESSVPGVRPPSLVVSIINGGEKANIVPDRCTVTIDRRIIPEEKGDVVEQEILQILNRLRKEDKELEISTETILLAKSSGPLPKDHILIETLVRRGTEVLGEEISVTGTSGFGDARFFWERGIPVCCYGPASKSIYDNNVHGGDENIVLDDLKKSTKVLALTLLDLLS